MSDPVFSVGDRVMVGTPGDSIGPFRIMAIAERWALVRSPRAVPFAAFLSDCYPAAAVDGEPT